MAMSEERREAAATKALSTWSANHGRDGEIRAFQDDRAASAKLISRHVDRKSAYTVRSRLQVRYPTLLFKVYGGEGGAGCIWVKHNNDKTWDQDGAPVSVTGQTR